MHAGCRATKNLHEFFGLMPGADDEIDDHVGSKSSQLNATRRDPMAIATNVFYTVWRWSGAPMKQRQRMSFALQRLGGEAPHESTSANQENAHNIRLSLLPALTQGNFEGRGANM